MRYNVTASGTRFTPKIHRQFNASTRTPPSTGPMTNAVPVHAVQVPIARAWAAPENRALIMVSELGTRNAAPTPCSTRAATSTHPEGATAHSTDETAKINRPIRRTLLLPNWSDTAPATRIKAPSAKR